MVKRNWDNLTKEERSEYMRLQTAHGGGLLVEVDVGERYYDCDNSPCTRMVRGGGLCSVCYLTWIKLYDKLIALPPADKELPRRQNENTVSVG